VSPFSDSFVQKQSSCHNFSCLCCQGLDWPHSKVREKKEKTEIISIVSSVSYSSQETLFLDLSSEDWVSHGVLAAYDPGIVLQLEKPHIQLGDKVAGEREREEKSPSIKCSGFYSSTNLLPVAYCFSLHVSLCFIFS
jgi:hypothetical protein